MSYSGTITPSAGWPTVKKPVNGDDVDGTDQTEVEQALADRDQLLYTRLIPLTQYHPYIGNAADAEWARDDAYMAYGSQTTNASEYLMLPLAGLVHGATITAWAVSVQGTGAYGATPAVKNTARLYKKTMSTGASTSIGALITDSATFGGSPDMTDIREISESGLSEVVDLSLYHYFIRVEHESGAGAQTGVYCYGAKTTCTRPTS